MVSSKNNSFLSLKLRVTNPMNDEMFVRTQRSEVTFTIYQHMSK